MDTTQRQFVFRLLATAVAVTLPSVPTAVWASVLPAPVERETAAEREAPPEAPVGDERESEPPASRLLLTLPDLLPARGPIVTSASADEVRAPAACGSVDSDGPGGEIVAPGALAPAAAWRQDDPRHGRDCARPGAEIHVVTGAHLLANRPIPPPAFG